MKFIITTFFFLLSLCSSFAYGDDFSVLEGKTLVYRSSKEMQTNRVEKWKPRQRPLQRVLQNGDIIIVYSDSWAAGKKGEKNNIISYKGVGNAHFKLFKARGDRSFEGKDFFVSKGELLKNIRKGMFGESIKKLLKKKFKKKKIRKRKNIKKLAKRNYTMAENAPAIKIKLLETGERATLEAGDEFYIKTAFGKERIVINPWSGVYDIKEKSKFNSLFKNGNIIEGKYLREKKQISKPVESLKYTFSEIERGLPRVEGVAQGCFDDKNHKHMSSIYNKCNKNDNYIEQILKGRVIKGFDPGKNEKKFAKYCILAGLSNKGITRTAKCSNGKFLDGTAPCKSKSYVNYMYQQIKAVKSCFDNISLYEMLPLINHESRFYHNAYNRGSNATGPLQLVQNLINTQKQKNSFIHKGSMNQTSFCKDIRKSILKSPITKEVNICKRVDFPGTILKQLFIPMAQYSYAKSAKSEKDSVIGMEELTHVSDKFPNTLGVPVFAENEKTHIEIDLARISHNKGWGDISKYYLKFIYDLLHEFNNQKETKKDDPYKVVGRYLSVEHYTKIAHGNRGIKGILKNPEFRAMRKKGYLMDRDLFFKYFLSYYFYEKAKSLTPGRQRRVHPYSTNIGNYYEGPLYLYKIECEQFLMSKKARQLAKDDHFQGDLTKSCSTFPVSSQEIKRTLVDVGWYYNVCGNKKINKKKSSRRKCMSKDPYTAVDRKGRRRLTDKKIKSFQADERKARLCDNESLWGLASRPLLKYYAKDPGAYNAK